MARLEPGSNFFSLTKEIERLKYQLLQYKTLLGVAPFDKIALKGDKGDIGPRGLRGEQGVPGPKGDKGDKGDTGAKGDTGNTGAQGIKGDRGDRGEKGNTGATGATGATGPRGLQGIQGEKGDKGEQGVQGIQGIQGLRGYKGDTGKYGETKFVINENMELEQHTLIGDPLNFSLVDDELVLTEGGETVNLGTVIYKNPNVIDMRAGEYLMDKIIAINALPEAKKPTVDNTVTINFYNHSKTIDWSRYTEKIHWPRHVYLNFVGKINPWPNVYNPRMGFHEGLLSSNPTDKLFLGFSFDRTNDDSVIKVSGLPENVQKVFFGGLDQSYQIAGSYQNLIDNPEDWGEFEFGLVRVNGSKDDDVRNDALYKKINGVFVDVTPDFRYVDFSGCDLKLSYFYSANNQVANFYSANNQGANFYSANNQDANFVFANNNGVIFNYTNNQCANFGYANNQDAIFNYSNNQNASFSFANNQTANFYSANNQDAYFDSANNQVANFSFANNQGAYFYSANNQKANFSFANNQGSDFYSANNQGANFQYSNNQGANFVNSNLKQANWNNVVSIANANFQDADLTGGTNLPERINTKAKWIAECGAINVNAQTIWIDGTSILS